MAMIDCPRCRRPSEAGARFCMHCGGSTTPQVHCPACNQLQPAGARFCMSCGAQMAGATYQGGLSNVGDGAVIDGVWQRGPDEFIRRVLPEDCRTFLGNRVLRIPPGTVGVVVIGGKVERLLPPGEQTAMPLFERITHFFSGKGAGTALYLLDLRPIQVPFALQTRPTDSGRSIQAQVLVSFQVPRGDRDAVGMFIDSVLGARSGFSAGDLYNLLRPEVTRIAGQVLERLAGTGDLRYAEAEAEIRRALSEQLARRYGLLIDVGVAPLTTTASLSFHLGEGEGASLFTSEGEAIELDIVVRVQGQHEDFAPERLRPALQGTAAARLRSLPLSHLSTGEGFAALEDALRTDVARELASFGMQLVSINVIDVRSRNGVWLLGARAELLRAEADLGIRQQHQELHQGQARLDIAAAELSAQRQVHLDAAGRTVTVAQRTDRKADELDAIRHDSAKADTTFTGRADLARKEMDLTAEQKQRALQVESQQVRRRAEDGAHAARQRDEAAFDDHARRAHLSEELSDRAETRQIDKMRAMTELDMQMAAQEQGHELKLRDSLRGLNEREMIAMQAAQLARSEGGGASWAQALAAGEAQREKEQRLADQGRHAGEVKDLLRENLSSMQGVMQEQLDRMAQLTTQAMAGAAEQKRDAGAAEVYGRSLDAMAQVAASRAAPAPTPVVMSTVAAAADTPAQGTACPGCGTSLRPDARFCLSCGAAVLAPVQKP